jgi:hypothetical protein
MEIMTMRNAEKIREKGSLKIIKFKIISYWEVFESRINGSSIKSADVLNSKHVNNTLMKYINSLST